MSSMSKKTNPSKLDTHQLRIEIEAIERAIEGAYYVVEVAELFEALTELNNELRSRD